MSAADDDLAFLSATALARLVRLRQVSPVDLVNMYLARIERLDRSLGAFIAVCAADARAAAREAERALSRGGKGGPLHGLPFAVKDQFDAAGLRTTAGSRVLADNVAAEDATVVARLKAAGAILVGKLNMSEFALGGTVRFPFGQPHNPWRLDRQPGGSSGGSGIAAAAALSAFALGEDTGGSIRGPAAFCGVVGIRATWGRVSQHGSVSVSWSLDVAGPLTRTVADSALVLAAIAGEDPKDPLTSRRPVPDYRAALTEDTRGLRIGVVQELMDGGTAPEVRAAVETAAGRLADLGAAVTPVSLPSLPLAGATFMAVCDPEGAAAHQRWLRERPGDYDQATRRRLYTASLLPAALHHQAARARARIRQEMLGALAQHDLLLSPAAPAPAPPIAREAEPVTSKETAARRFFGHRSHSTPASLAGVPAIAIPCGFSADGLPIGLQLAGRPFDEATVFRAAHAYEQSTDWHTRRPPMA